MNVLKSAYIYFTGSGINILIPFISILVIANYLGANELGLLALSQSYGAIISAFATLALPLVYEREFFKRSKISKEILLLNFFILILFLGFIFFILLTFFLYIFLDKFHFNYLSMSQILLGYLSVFFGNLISIFTIYYRNIKKPKQYTLINFINLSLTSGFSVFLLILVYRSFETILISQTLIRGFLISSLFILFFKKTEFRFNTKILIKSFKFSLSLTPKFIVGIIGNQIDKLLLAGFSSLDNLGVYSLAQRIGNSFVIFTSSIENLYLPKISSLIFKKNKINKFILIGKIITPFFYLSTLTCILFGSLFVCLDHIFLSSDYQNLDLLLLIMLPYYFILFFGRQNQLLYMKKIKIINILAFLKIIIHPILNYYLIIEFAAIGAALATLISGLILISLSQFFCNLYCQIKWELKKIIVISSMFIIFVLYIYLSNDLNIMLEINLIFNLAILIFYLVIGYLFNFHSTLFKKL